MCAQREPDYKPSDEDKKEALDSVFYEICQLYNTCFLTHHNGSMRNALLESKLIHVRTLRDFFQKKNRYKDQILSEDYRFDARTIKIPQDYNLRLDKDLAHLTYSRNMRRNVEDKEWPFEEVILPVLKRSLEFIEQLDEELKGKSKRVSTKDWEDLRKALTITCERGLHKEEQCAIDMSVPSTTGIFPI